MRVIAHPHSFPYPCGRQHDQRFFRYAGATAAASSLHSTSTCWLPSCNEVGQRGWEDWSNVLAPLQIGWDWFEGERDAFPWCLDHRRS